MEMNIADQLVHTTVRIECIDSEGRSSSDTGFFFDFGAGDDGKVIPVLITNKHVIKDAQSGVFHLHVAGEEGQPLYGNHVKVRINQFENGWIPHPEADVDLAVYPLGPVVKWFAAKGKEIFRMAVNRDFMALADDLSELGAVEDILMVGYPNGLWDAKNNFPIVRRGITATPPYIDFEGKKEFMIDCACFPGSSGSPIFLYNIGTHVNKAGGIKLGSGRVKLIGVLWGGPQHTAEGIIRVMPIPTRDEPVAFSRIPNNLGYCIKAEKLLAFEQHFERMSKAQGEVAKGEVEEAE